MLLDLLVKRVVGVSHVHQRLYHVLAEHVVLLPQVQDADYVALELENNLTLTKQQKVCWNKIFCIFFQLGGSW